MTDTLIVDYDVETTGFQREYHEAFSYQFFDGEKGEIIWRGDDQWRENVQAWFDRVKACGGKLRAWNTKFDRGFGEAAGFDLPGDGHWLDGMLEAHALDERRSMALKAIGESLGFSEGADLQRQVRQWLTDERKRRVKQAKEEGMELIEPNYSDVPRDLMEQYAMEDVYLTRKVCDAQAPLLERNSDLARIVEFEHEAMDALYAVEQRGIPADEEGYRKLELELIENLETMEDRLNGLAAVGIEQEHIDSGGWEFNPKSSKQIYKALQCRDADMTFVTNESMDKENLETVDDELAVEVLNFRSEFKVLSTYVRPYIGRSWDKDMRVWKEPFVCPDGRIHATYRQVGARTGRMSCIAEGSLVDCPRDLLKYPRGVPIEQISPGQMVYSFDTQGIPRPKRVKAVLKQGRKPVLRLVWRAAGNKSYLGELEATADHRIRLRDGRYKRLDQLQAGDQLAFLSRQVTGDGYARIVWKHGSGDGISSSVDEHRHLCGSGEVTHHKNARKLDNRLENLEPLAISEHSALHNPVGSLYPKRYKPCPYQAATFTECVSGGIRSAIALYGHDHRTWKRWAAELGVSIPDKRVRGTEPVNHVVVAVIDDGKEAETYDLSIEDTPNFVVNEIGVHNCADPNMQNQPRDDLRLRYNIKADPGFKLVTCDLNSIEMAVFAAYAGNGRLLEAVKEGRDIHTMTAEFVGIRDRVRPGGHVESARQRGKTFGFAIIYGAGVRSVRKMMRCSQAEARQYLKRYHDAYPEVGRLQSRVEWRLQDTGYIKSAWGRRYHMDSRDAYKGVNYLVQGTAADLLKASLIRLHKDGVPIVACIHDELIAHVPEADAEEAKQTMIEALIDHPRITEHVPLAAEGDIVDRWSEAKNPTFKPRWAS